MNIDDDYDNDGNNIVPCPICDDVYCPSKEDGKCPEEDEFAKHYLNTPDTEETFINKVWEVLKGDHTDLNRQARILQLYRSAIISHTTYWKEQMEKAVLKGERNRIIEKIREERDTYWKERVEEIYSHFSWCQECAEGPTCKDALAIKDNLK